MFAPSPSNEKITALYRKAVTSLDDFRSLMAMRTSYLETFQQPPVRPVADEEAISITPEHLIFMDEFNSAQPVQR